MCLFGPLGRAIPQPARVCHWAILSVWQEVQAARPMAQVWPGWPIAYRGTISGILRS
jgi:hypothetical protein